MLERTLCRDKRATQVEVDHAVELLERGLSNFFGIAVPALLTNTSSPPKPATVLSIAALT